MNGYWIGIAVLSTVLLGCMHHDHPISVTVVHVPDSGQTQSYTSAFGQDSDYLLHPPSYLDNGNGTITDNVTGLMWQKEYNGAVRLSTEADDYCAGLIPDGLFKIDVMKVTWIPVVLEASLNLIEAWR